MPSPSSFVSFLPPADKLILHSHGRFHYWGHLAVFAVAGFLAVQTTRSLRARTAAFTACILFGLILEVGEHLVFHSPMEWKDVLVDAVGVCAGTLLARIVAHRPIPPGAPHA